MVTADRELEQVRETLDRALEKAEDDSARYHIRRAAQRIVILRDGLADEHLETEVSERTDHGDAESS